MVASIVAESTGALRRNTANALTCVRLALALPIAALVLAGSHAALGLAALLFAVAGLTDFLDGRIARRQGRVSALGCRLDPLADKFVIDATIAILVLTHVFPPALAVLFVGRDLAVTLLRLCSAPDSEALAPNATAKLKTSLLYFGVGGLILGRITAGPLVGGAWLLVGGAAVLSVLSAWQYCRRVLSAAPVERLSQR